MLCTCSQCPSHAVDDVFDGHDGYSTLGRFIGLTLGGSFCCVFGLPYFSKSLGPEVRVKDINFGSS